MSAPSAPPPIVLRDVQTLADRRDSLVLSGGRIAGFIGGDSGEVALDARVLDASGLTASPGFIDLQVNGAAGHDITGDPASIWAVGTALTRYGVTAFLPTIVTSGPEIVERAQAVLAAGPPPAYCGATPLGLHVEGPFLNPARRGVHDAALLRQPDLAWIADWAPATGIRLVTLAPELPGALPLIAALAANGVIVSVGHSAATFEQAVAAIDAGATYATHLFNGMAPLDHRAPGLIAALLRDERVSVGVIADGAHVHPAVVDLAWRLVGARRFSAVTDAVSALGASSGDHTIGGASLAVDAATAVARSGERLAGGVVGLDVCLRNLAAFTGASLPDVVGTVTAVPARLLRLRGGRGRLRRGAPADITLLTPHRRVAATIVGGAIAWTDPEHAAWA